MKVILRESWENLGAPGDIVEVKPGFARNFLVPQGVAYPANRFYRRLFEVERDELVRRDEEARKRAEGVAEKGHEVEIEFQVKIGERGKMFGAITNTMIAEKLAEHGIEVDRRKILLPEPLKTTGTHTVLVRPHGLVEFEVKVNLVAEEGQEELRELSIRELVEGETGIITPEKLEEAVEAIEGNEEGTVLVPQADLVTPAEDAGDDAAIPTGEEATKPPVEETIGEDASDDAETSAEEKPAENEESEEK